MASKIKRAFGAAGSVEHEVINDADHGLSQRGWRRAWGEVLPAGDLLGDMLLELPGAAQSRS